jgi:hypothetical protein
MKKEIFRLLLATTILSFAISCKDDEKKPSIIGTWIQLKTVWENCDDSDYNEITNYVCETQNCRTITFYENNTWSGLITIDGDEYVDTGTYKLDGNLIRMCEDTTDPCDDGEISELVFNGNSKLKWIETSIDFCDAYHEYIRQ